MRFHRKCGDRITLLNNNSTAVRNFVEFNHGLILSAEPLKDDVVFEVSIDRKVNVWNGSLEIGVTTLDPEVLELPATATKLRNTAWIMSGSSIVKDGVTLLNGYGPELDGLREGDFVGVMRSSKDELLFFINGRCLGVAAKDMPPKVFGVIDLYGQCVQVTIITTIKMRRNLDDSKEQADEDPNNDETLTSSQQEEACGFSDTAISKETNDVFVPMASNAACAMVVPNRLRFHPRCGILVKLTANNRTAERARPLDDYNNGVVMTHRPLHDDEMFEIRIEKLVDKWSGSIEVGVTTHNPSTIKFPSTMTNMDSGTIMMSGCKVLVNGHGTCMEYRNFNLDELKEGDTVGMMKKYSKLHYFINGVDQGCATDRVDPQVWGVVDLYGMTVKVSIMDGAEVMETAVQTSHCTPRPVAQYRPPQIPEDSLLFHTLRDSNVIIINDGKTAHRPNAFEYFNNGVVMTNRTLKTNELFQVRLDQVVPKWAGSIEIGVTQHSCYDIEFPFKMSTAKSKIWAMTGEDVIRDGSVIIPQYVRNLNKLVEGNTVGVMRKDMGILHFFVNGVDQGPAAFNIPEHVFGIIDLYGRVAQATIVDCYFPPPTYSPESPLSSSNSAATVLPEMCFHRVHGRNARLSRNRLTVSRTTVFSEFNDAVLFSSRPLRECEMFEIRIDKMVDCWIGSLEIGVTAINPDLLESGGGVGNVGTATDLALDTYILSGSAIMKDGECARSGYNLDLDLLNIGSRVGMMWHADRSLHYYLDGMDQGRAWYVPHLNIYAVVDLYGQCTQVTILQNEERQFNYNGYYNGDTTYFVNARMAVMSPPPPYCFSEYCGDNITLMHDYSFARRRQNDPFATLVFSAGHLVLNELFEIKITKCNIAYAGGLRIGVTDINILNVHVNRCLPPGVKYLPHYTAYVDGRYLKYTKPHTRVRKRFAVAPSLEWLHVGDRVGLKKVESGQVLLYYNSEQLDLAIEDAPDKVYVVMELYGSVMKIQSISKFLGRGISLMQPTAPLEEPEIVDAKVEEESAESQPTALPEEPPAPARPRPYTFYYVHGNNIKLCSSDTVAVRTAGYNDGVAIVSTPIKRGRSFRFRVDKIDGDWSGSVGIGAVAELPEDLPEVSMDLPAPAWIINSELINDNGLLSNSSAGAQLEELQQQSVLSLHFRFNGDLVLALDGKVVGLIANVPRQYKLLFPVIDLYGKVNQVSILLHPYIVTRGASLDLPIIKESTHEDPVPDQDVDEDELSGASLSPDEDEDDCCPPKDGLPPLPDVYKIVPEEPAEVQSPCAPYGASPPLYVMQDEAAALPEMPALSELPEMPAMPEMPALFELPEMPALSALPQMPAKSALPQMPTLSALPPMPALSALPPMPASSALPEMPAQPALPEMPVLPAMPALSALPEMPALSTLPAPLRGLPSPVTFHTALTYEFPPYPHYNDVVNRCIQKSKTTHTFVQPPEDEIDDQDSLRQTFLMRMMMEEEECYFNNNDRRFDTNIQHNDRYPEANEVDLDSELMHTLSFDPGNLPDLTDEQSPPAEAATRRHGMRAGERQAQTRYLLFLLGPVRELQPAPMPAQEGLAGAGAELEAGGACEHLHLVMKFWKFVWASQPEMRAAMHAWGQLHCHCSNCEPESLSPNAGWVAINRKGPRADSYTRFWCVDRVGLTTPLVADGECGPVVRARAASPLLRPTITDIWFDEEGKPHRVVLVLEIEAAPVHSDDRLRAILIRLRVPDSASDTDSSVD